MPPSRKKSAPSARSRKSAKPASAKKKAAKTKAVVAPPAKAPAARTALALVPVIDRRETETPLRFELGVDPAKVDDAIRRLREQVGTWVRRGFGDKIRLKYKTKPIGPDIPVAYFLAAEAFAFWSTGVLRMLLVNFGAKALLEVEFISSAVEHHTRGVERYLAGDLEAAADALKKAVESDDYHAASHRMLGTVLRIRGDEVGARRHLARTLELDPNGPEGAKAKELLREMA